MAGFYLAVISPLDLEVFMDVRGYSRILQIPYIFYWFVYTIILYFYFFFCKCVQYVVDDSRNKYDPFTQNNAYRT